MPQQVSRMIWQTVALPTLKLNDCDCCESPEARCLRVMTILSAGGIGIRLLHCFLAMNGPTSWTRCSSRSGDILNHLKNKVDIHDDTTGRSWLMSYITGTESVVALTDSGKESII